MAYEFIDDEILKSVRKDVLTIIKQYEKNYTIRWAEGII
jgi:hypothetical protein